MDKAIELFAELFRGNTSCYGVHIPESEVLPEGQKAKGRSFIKSEELTLDVYADHLKGKQSIGVVPIDANNNVRFAAIDVDVYPLNPWRYCVVIQKYKLPLVPFKSKSGGLHLFCFFSEDIAAEKALSCLDIMRHLLLIPSDVEMFPKQRRLAAKGKGNFINLPLYQGEQTTRYAYQPNGEPMEFKQALKHCRDSRVTYKALMQRLSKLPLSSAPPCLQALYINNEVSVTARNRNIFLFNAAIYLKARWKEEFAERLAYLNETLDQALDNQELESTIIASHNRSNYAYQCEDASLKSCCNKTLCKTREFGKGCSTVSDFTFEQLVQVNSNPPYYKWTVNGAEMVFYKESELRAQDKFLDLCLRYLHKVPNKLKVDAWNDILNTALQDIRVEDVTTSDLSPYSMWLSYFREYLTERILAQVPEQVITGLVYYNEVGYWFKIEHFAGWLNNTKKFKEYSFAQMHYMFKSLGVAPRRFYIPQRKTTVRMWCCPVKALEYALAKDDEQNPELEPHAPVIPPAPAPQEETTPAQSRKKGVARLEELLGDLPEDTLDFSKYKDEEKF